MMTVSDIRGWMGLSFPDICLTVEEKPQKNLNLENGPDRVSKPGPLSERQRCYPRPQRRSLSLQMTAKNSEVLDFI